jgi:hypothetical protein
MLGTEEARRSRPVTKEIPRAEFIAKVLKLANDKARELGWIK